MGFGFDWIFNLFPLFFMVVFVLVIGTFISVAIRGARQWKSNNAAPVLTVEACLVAKRTNVSRHHHDASTDMGMDHVSTSSTYYATFQVESGDRLELQVPGSEYGLLVEGDRGRLTFQGTRYQGFVRQRG